MKIYTIGFTKKSARLFFSLLEENEVKKILDIRLNNISQLSGFAKGRDLSYFLNKILDVDYIHDTRFSPTKDLLDRYKTGELDWPGYEREFNEILVDRRINNVLLTDYIEALDGICLLCSEAEADQCHRRLVAEFIKNEIKELEIIHL